jgi:transcription elongation factor Elf1
MNVAVNTKPLRSNRVKTTRVCPWCGIFEKDHMNLFYVKAGSGEYFVNCWNCGAMGPEGDTKGEALKNWNERSDYGGTNTEESEK